MTRLASIIVDNTSKNVDREFDYIIPSNLEKSIEVGMRVIVPFGNGNKSLEGYVVGITEGIVSKNIKYKNIIDIVDDDILFTPEMIKIAYFLKQTYHCTLSEAFKIIMPSGATLKENLFIRIKDSSIEKKNNRYNSIINNLNEDKFIEFKQLNKKLNINIARFEMFEMERLGLIEIKREMLQNINVKTESVYRAVNPDKCKEFIEKDSPKFKRQIEVLRLIIENNLVLTKKELCEKLKCSSSVIEALEEKGFLAKTIRELYRNPFNLDYSYNKLNLTEDQRAAVESILESFKSGKNISLIHGVTGCGKTEIYLHLIEKFISEDNGAIMLVPEIALTPQTVQRFKGRFGDTVAVFHSKLSEGERFDEWRRIKKGEVKVVVGARSAVFAPLKNLKIIIIDEEHEYSYKSELSPKYLTHEVAEFRVNHNNGLLVLGSATPSLESYYKAENNLYNLIEIDKRVDNKTLPEVNIVDMRDELRNGNKSMFSRELYEAIAQNIEDGNQTILFLNRRGYSTFISCRSCGYICKCKSCEVSMTYHISSNRMSCHYCGAEASAPRLCPSCGSKYIKYFGIGTEKIEEEIKRTFTSARVLRMDMDTTRKKGEHERIYNEFKDNKADILIGTQMISKGMDFKDVTLVGVIAADTSLNLPDFRAAERTFQLLTQVSGRAGRGGKNGRVIVQTYEPDNYSILFAREHDYKGFYKKEIDLRRVLNNPPFTNILYVLFTSEDENELIKYSMIIGKKLEHLKNKSDIEVLGPTPCHISKIKNNYRWHLVLKGDVLLHYDDAYLIISKELEGSKVSFSLDINPYSMI